MIAEVIVDITNEQVDKVFDYVALLDTVAGERVVVPFGRRIIEGYVLRLKENSDLPNTQLKSIISAKDDYPVLLPEFIDLNDKLKKIFHLRNVDCMRMFIPTQLRNGTARPLYTNYLTVDSNFNAEELLLSVRSNATRQKKLISNLVINESYPESELKRLYGAQNVKKLVDAGWLKLTTINKLRAPQKIDKPDKVVSLNSEQLRAVSSILDNRERVHLLFGVTGSGKTEVYMHIINQVLSEGKTAILLVPEISLTPQVLATFTARFGNEVAILHSGLSAGERYDEWQRLRTGLAKIAIGARSAIFAPLKNLGVIILDEEHDPSYKAESNPRYETHTIAKLRGEYNGCPVIFGSATPSLDSFLRAKNGEYMLHSLPNRANKRAMPKIEVVNMCDEIHKGNTSIFSETLLSEITQCVENDEQAMLFLNRRGFSSYMICRECGYVAKCQDCDVSLVYHKEDNELKCHYCHRRYKALTNCPKCNSSYLRMGNIGTQKVVEELRAKFPDVTILRMDFDTTKKKNDLNEILHKFAETRPCILVGTQMIAKGHDFPDVTLVGIINADMGLHFSDYRAPERTFQLITQVAGRAGRAEKEGKVILQTYTPRHYVYRFAQNYDYLGFYKKEINLREVTKFPPFSKIMRLLISADERDLAHLTTSRIFDSLGAIRQQYSKQFLYCRAMSSPITRIENRYRFQIILRFTLDSEQEIIDEIYRVIGEDRHPKCSVFVEINPGNMS